MTEDLSLAAAQDGARLAGMLPYLAEDISRLEKVLENKTFMALDKGTLTPQDALNAWIEKRAYRRLSSHFDQRVRVGISAANRHQENLNIQPGINTLHRQSLEDQ